jgi:hypothetical protein
MLDMWTSVLASPGWQTSGKQAPLPRSFRPAGGARSFRPARARPPGEPAARNAIFEEM